MSFIFIPYLLIRISFNIFMINLNEEDFNNINKLIYNDDYIMNVYDIKLGLKRQTFVDIPNYKWYFDPIYEECMDEELFKLKNSNICYYNGTHVMIYFDSSNKVYQQNTFLKGLSYCKNKPPNIISRNVCVPIFRNVYEMISMYFYISTSILILFNLEIF